MSRGGKPIIARQTRIFEMRDSEELGRVTPLVEQLYKEQIDEAGTGPADAIILRDENTHRLIVRARPDHLAQIEMLISELRLAKPLAKPRTTVMLPLANRKVDQVYRNIDSLVNDRMGETPFRDQPKPRLIEDRVNNRVIVYCQRRAARGGCAGGAVARRASGRAGAHDAVCGPRGRRCTQGDATGHAAV